MLLGPVAGADAEEWDRMIAINVQGLLYTTRAALPHLLQAAKEGPRTGRRPLAADRAAVTVSDSSVS